MSDALLGKMVDGIRETCGPDAARRLEEVIFTTQGRLDMSRWWASSLETPAPPAQERTPMKFTQLAEIVRRNLSAEDAERVLAAICREANGEQVYIPARHAPPEIKPTDTPKTIQRRYKVSRATAHNWVTKWRLR